MGQVLSLPVQLESVDCGCCGGTYAINQAYKSKAYQDGLSWTCPYCKAGWGYSGQSENAKLKKQLEAEKVAREAERQRKDAALARANEAEAKALKTERANKRLKTRVAAGTCPCCTRTFSQLARHMATKHPEHKEAA